MLNASLSFMLTDDTAFVYHVCWNWRTGPVIWIRKRSRSMNGWNVKKYQSVSRKHNIFHFAAKQQLKTFSTLLPWCMSGSLTRGGEENIPGTPGACATHNLNSRNAVVFREISYRTVLIMSFDQRTLIQSQKQLQKVLEDHVLLYMYQLCAWRWLVLPIDH